MLIGVLTVEYALHGNDSLKGKRRVANSLKQKVRNTFNVAVAEAGTEDSLVRLQGCFHQQQRTPPSVSYGQVPGHDGSGLRRGNDLERSGNNGRGLNMNSYGASPQEEYICLIPPLQSALCRKKCLRR